MAASEMALVEKNENQILKRGITEAQWYTLMNSLYPGARPASVVLVWDYCTARKLDPMKKPCHIVPMEVKDAQTGQYAWRDVVLPGIYEVRTTAHRTGQYLGHSKPEYGEVCDFPGVDAPEWCEMTIYRKLGTERAEFPVRVYFSEVVATKKGGEANARWARAPIQMLTKCTEAAGLREAFPDEIGGEHTAEEMEGQRAIDIPADTLLPKTGTITLESLKPSESENRGHDGVAPEQVPVQASSQSEPKTEAPAAPEKGAVSSSISAPPVSAKPPFVADSEAEKERDTARNVSRSPEKNDVARIPFDTMMNSLVSTYGDKPFYEALGRAGYEKQGDVPVKDFDTVYRAVKADLDLLRPQAQPEAAPPKNAISQPQVKRLFAIGKSNGWSQAQIDTLLADRGYSNPAFITKGKVYDLICKEVGIAPPQSFSQEDQYEGHPTGEEISDADIPF